MDANLRAKADLLAKGIAGQATTVQDLKGLLRRMMKAALERMLDAELDVHLGRGPTVQAEPVVVRDD